MRRVSTITLWLWPGVALAALFGSLFAGTPPADLGARNGRLAACPAKPNCVSSQAADAPHRTEPFPFTGSATEAFATLARVVAAQPGATIVTRGDGYLYATFQTALLGFVDDVEFVVDAARRVIDVRSASRLGNSDFGTNGRRVETLLAAFAGARA
jgi:uncharacterized protein (DUF1499 family)